MGFMDKVKETAAKGTEMAKGAAKAGQEKIDEQKTKKKVADLREELGGIVYAQRTGGAPVNADVEITRIVGEITEAEAALASIRADNAMNEEASGDAPGGATSATPPSTTSPSTTRPSTTPPSTPGPAGETSLP